MGNFNPSMQGTDRRNKGNIVDTIFKNVNFFVCGHVVIFKNDSQM